MDNITGFKMDDKIKTPIRVIFVETDISEMSDEEISKAIENLSIYRKSFRKVEEILMVEKHNRSWLKKANEQ